MRKLMQDKLGIYYNPQPGNKKARVYVRKDENNIIEFRLWQQDHPRIWDKHQWLSLDVIEKAAELYKQTSQNAEDANPMNLYDVAVAKALLSGNS